MPTQSKPKITTFAGRYVVAHCGRELTVLRSYMLGERDDAANAGPTLVPAFAVAAGLTRSMVYVPARAHRVDATRDWTTHMQRADARAVAGAIAILAAGDDCAVQLDRLLEGFAGKLTCKSQIACDALRAGFERGEILTTHGQARAHFVPGVGVLLAAPVYGCDGRIDRVEVRTYAIGDRCGYDGYNLTYTGTLASVGERAKVEILSGKSRLLNAASFAVWNARSVAEIDAANAIERHNL